MMINVGSTLPQSEVEPLVQYLAKKFSLRDPDLRPKMISGNAKFSITEWMVPTPGSRPHDPSRDG
jgi:virginiamycin B lyase